MLYKLEKESHFCWDDSHVVTLGPFHLFLCDQHLLDSYDYYMRCAVVLWLPLRHDSQSFPYFSFFTKLLMCIIYPTNDVWLDCDQLWGRRIPVNNSTHTQKELWKYLYMRRHFYTFCQFEFSLSLSLLDSLFSFMKILFGHLRKKKKHHHPYDLVLYSVGRSIRPEHRLLSPVVNFFFFFFFTR